MQKQQLYLSDNYYTKLSIYLTANFLTISVASLPGCIFNFTIMVFCKIMEKQNAMKCHSLLYASLEKLMNYTVVLMPNSCTLLLFLGFIQKIYF